MWEQGQGWENIGVRNLLELLKIDIFRVDPTYFFPGKYTLQSRHIIFLLLKYLKNLFVILFWSFKSSLRLYFDNILGFLVNKAVNSFKITMV